MFYRVLISTILLGFFPLINLNADPLTARGFSQKYLGPLLAERPNQQSISVTEPTGQSPGKIILRSGTPGRWLGRYEIILNPKTSELPAQAPALNMNWGKVAGTPLVELSTTVELPLDPKEDPTPFLRSMLRSDFLLHPMLTPPGAQPVLAPVQKEIVSQFDRFIETARQHNEATRGIIILPPGFGKTIIAGKLLEKLIGHSSGPYKIIFVVQNKEILDEATSKLTDLLDLKPAQVRRAYGDSDKENLFDNNTVLVSTTRTTLHRNLDAIIEAREKFAGRVYVVLDEVHHAGKIDGEFETILDQLGRSLRVEDLLLGLTATPWHSDSDLIERIFGGNVATALLSAEERQRFLSERQLIYMSRLMLFRAMAEGYLSPIHSYRQVRYLENEGELPILARAFLNDWTRRFADLSESERYAELKREILIHVPLVRQMIKEILATIRRDPATGRLLFPNRGVIFVPSIAHANVYAFLMNQRAPKGKDIITAKAFHSGLSDDERARTLDWFRDQTKSSGGPRRYQGAENLKPEEHKYLFAIRALGEGVDEPRVNHIILARPYSEDDPVGMRELIQNLGRGSRLSYPKPDFTVSDFTGDMKRLIFDNMDQKLLNRFFVEGGEQDFDPQPEMVKPEREKTAAQVVLDYSTLNPDSFTADAISIPERHFTAGTTSPPPAIAELPEPPPWPSAAPATIAPEVAPVSVSPNLPAGHPWLRHPTWRGFLDMPGSARLLLDEANADHSIHRRNEWGGLRSWNRPYLDYSISHYAYQRPQDLRYVAGVKSLVATLLRYRVFRQDLELFSVNAERQSQENRLDPTLRSALDQPVPWSWAQLVEFDSEAIPALKLPKPVGNEIEQIKALARAPRPTIFEALSSVQAGGEAQALDRRFTWKEAFDSPAFLVWFLSTAGESSKRFLKVVSDVPISLDSALRSEDRQSWLYYPAMGQVKARELAQALRDLGFRPEFANGESSDFTAERLLNLNESIVWKWTLPEGSSYPTDLSIGDRLIQLMGESDKKQDFLRRMRFALGFNFPDLSQWEVQRSMKAERYPSVQDSLKSQQKRFTQGEWIKPATWREFYSHPAAFQALLAEAGFAGEKIEGTFAAGYNIKQAVEDPGISPNLKTLLFKFGFLDPVGGDELNPKFKKALDEPSPFWRSHLYYLAQRLAKTSDEVDPFFKLPVPGKVGGGVDWQTKSQKVPTLAKAMEKFGATMRLPEALPKGKLSALFEPVSPERFSTYFQGTSTPDVPERLPVYALMLPANLLISRTESFLGDFKAVSADLTVLGWIREAHRSGSYGWSEAAVNKVSQTLSIKMPSRWTIAQLNKLEAYLRRRPDEYSVYKVPLREALGGIVAIKQLSSVLGIDLKGTGLLRSLRDYLIDADAARTGLAVSSEGNTLDRTLELIGWTPTRLGSSGLLRRLRLDPQMGSEFFRRAIDTRNPADWAAILSASSKDLEALKPENEFMDLFKPVSEERFAKIFAGYALPVVKQRLPVYAFMLPIEAVIANGVAVRTGDTVLDFLKKNVRQQGPAAKAERAELQSLVSQRLQLNLPQELTNTKLMAIERFLYDEGSDEEWADLLKSCEDLLRAPAR